MKPGDVDPSPSPGERERDQGMRLQFGMRAGLRQEKWVCKVQRALAQQRSTSPNKKTEDPGGWN